MALKLYRRHRAECEAGHAEDSRTGEFEEGRRGWKKCACLIHVSGTLSKKSSRKQTGKSNWDEAKAVVTVWESAQSWDGVETAPVVPVPEPDTRRVTIARAIQMFTNECSHAAANTRKNYGLLMGKLPSGCRIGYAPARKNLAPLFSANTGPKT